MNQVACHKSKQTINESLAENQCVIPFIPLSLLPCKHKTVRANFSSKKKNVSSEHDRLDRIRLRGKINSGGQSL